MNESSSNHNVKSTHKYLQILHSICIENKSFIPFTHIKTKIFLKKSFMQEINETNLIIFDGLVIKKIAWRKLNQFTLTN